MSVRAALYHCFGRATARLHRAADDFTSRHARVPLDLAYFIDAPLAALRPRLAHRPDDRDYLIGLAGRVRARLAALASAGLDWGVCHGDLSLDNVHLAPDGRLVFYDFDSGGPGWRASDPYGVFQYAVLDRNNFWEAFLAGYREVRPFGAADMAAVPYFVVAQSLWSMGLEVRYWARWAGLTRVDDGYFDRMFAALRRWDAEQLDGERA
jgi:Ser/Thr protein kinase RdoA (MazF antagonist)